METLTVFLTNMGEAARLSGKAFRELFRPPFEWRLTIVQLEQCGIDSWSITFLTAIFTGMVMAMQFAIGLEPFGASMYTGKLVALGIVRELGPVLTALLVGGRVGSGFTAESTNAVLTGKTKSGAAFYGSEKVEVKESKKVARWSRDERKR